MEGTKGLEEFGDIFDEVSVATGTYEECSTYLEAASRAFLLSFIVMKSCDSEAFKHKIFHQ